MAKIALFRSETDTTDLDAGEFVFEEGAAGDAAYVVVEGEVEIRLGDKLIEAVGEGDVIGEMALVDDAPRMASAVARTPVRLAVIDQKRFLHLVHEHPTFALQVMAVMADRLRRMTQSVDG